MAHKQPYFMANKEWFYFDEERWMYKLTKKAPEKAIESYNNYYKELMEEKYNAEKNRISKD